MASRRFMEILMVLAKEIVERDLRVEEAVGRLPEADIDLSAVSEELRCLERLKVLSDEEIDAVRNVMVCLFMKHTDLEPDEVYRLVFSPGKRIIWN